MTRDYFQGDLNDDNDGGIPAPTLSDVLTRWRYTLAPTLYTDEDSSTDQQLHQQVLEQRAIRAWLVVIATLLGTLLPLVLVALALLLHNTAN